MKKKIICIVLFFSIIIKIYAGASETTLLSDISMSLHTMQLEGISVINEARYSIEQYKKWCDDLENLKSALEDFAEFENQLSKLGNLDWSNPAAINASLGEIGNFITNVDNIDYWFSNYSASMEKLQDIKKELILNGIKSKELMLNNYKDVSNLFLTIKEKKTDDIAKALKESISETLENNNVSYWSVLNKANSIRRKINNEQYVNKAKILKEEYDEAKKIMIENQILYNNSKKAYKKSKTSEDKQAMLTAKENYNQSLREYLKVSAEYKVFCNDYTDNLINNTNEETFEVLNEAASNASFTMSLMGLSF